MCKNIRYNLYCFFVVISEKLVMHTSVYEGGQEAQKGLNRIMNIGRESMYICVCHCIIKLSIYPLSLYIIPRTRQTLI